MIPRMRNILVHEYMQTNMDIVWSTATRNVPELVRLLAPLQDEASEPPSPGTK